MARKPLARYLYSWTRNLHLYIGLFLSPFLLLFAISVFFLNHRWIPVASGDVETTHTLILPAGFREMNQREQAESVRTPFEALGVTGEVQFIRHDGSRGSWEFQVMKPGNETTVRVDPATHRAMIMKSRTGLGGALIYLHRSPGPHSPALRGNWIYIRWWRVVADVSVYLLLLLSITGVYLWIVLKAERKAGLILLGLGCVTLMALVYSVSSFMGVSA